MPPNLSKISISFFELQSLFNHNSELGDSCAKILKITSSSFQAMHILVLEKNYAYSYDCRICMIVCLSVREFVLKLRNEDFQDQIYGDLQERVYGDFKTKYTRIMIFSF
jgi:hypothetical protein